VIPTASNCTKPTFFDWFVPTPFDVVRLGTIRLSWILQPRICEIVAGCVQSNWLYIFTYVGENQCPTNSANHFSACATKYSAICQVSGCYKVAVVQNQRGDVMVPSTVHRVE
jgi:hypothetical protein